MSSTAPAYIPPFIDHVALLRDLEAAGWRNYKLETACGFSVGYIDKLRKDPAQRMFYPSAARLWNLWCDEITRGAVSRGVSTFYEQAHNFSLTPLSA